MILETRIARARWILSWKHWAWATGTAVLVGVSSPYGRYDFDAYWIASSVIFYTPFFVFSGYLFLFAIAWVESARERTPASMGLYLRAAAIAGLLCVGVAWSLAGFLPRPPLAVNEGRVIPLPARFDPDTNWRISAAALLGLDAAFYGCLATLIYARLRGSRRAARALTEAQLGRSEADRSLLTSRFDAAQARVDPAYVIERLETIGRAYESDPAGADAQLDELISFLRDAIPRLRSDSALQVRE